MCMTAGTQKSAILQRHFTCISLCVAGHPTAFLLQLSRTHDHDSTIDPALLWDITEYITGPRLTTKHNACGMACRSRADDRRAPIVDFWAILNPDNTIMWKYAIKSFLLILLENIGIYCPKALPSSMPKVNNRSSPIIAGFATLCHIVVRWV